MKKDFPHLIGELTERNDPYKLSFHPFRIWRISVIIFCALFAGSVAFHVYVFRGIGEPGAPLEEGTQSGDIVDLKRLERVIDLFVAKETEFARLRTGEIPVVDPSK